jgi:hypothetical protein
MTTTQVQATDPTSKPWNVAPRAGFAVGDPRGEVALVQASRSKFRVLTPFRFTGDKIRQDLRTQLAKDGITGSTATEMIEKACTFEIDPDPRENNTDLASIPQFMRWFENPYGCHTLAAILHDQLIGKVPNDGALRSDTLADRFFRHLLEAGGVRPFKAMILWTATAIRSRWAVGGRPRVKLVLWGVLAALGLLALVNGLFLRSSWFGVGANWWLAAALIAPWPASLLLWGKQYGAGFVAAVALPWIVPVAALVLAASVIHKLFEAVVGLTPWAGRWQEQPRPPAGPPAGDRELASSRVA